jgi:hemoglobin
MPFPKIQSAAVNEFFSAAAIHFRNDPRTPVKSRRWMVKKIFIAVLGALLTFSAAQPVFAAQPQPDTQQAAPMGPSLYQRLGGYDALAAVTEDFLGRMAVDPQLKRFFIGFNQTSLVRIRQHIVDFLCQATGGPCLYHGQDMKTAHTGLHITEQDWNAAVTDLGATFDKFKVPEKERADVVAALSNLKADIVGR